jgi:hypothetical protein
MALCVCTKVFGIVIHGICYTSLGVNDTTIIYVFMKMLMYRFYLFDGLT